MQKILKSRKFLTQRTIYGRFKDRKLLAQTQQKSNAVIEIPYGSNIKYEIDKDSGAVVVDRVLYSAMFYPANYGFVPNNTCS